MLIKVKIRKIGKQHKKTDGSVFFRVAEWIKTMFELNVFT